MIILKKLCVFIFIFFLLPSIGVASFADQCKQYGYVELCSSSHQAFAFDNLYACFDEFVLFLQAHPAWAQKIYCAKERFIRSQYKNYYGTEFFGLYDESKRPDRNQISFYYAAHFHEFLELYYPEIFKISEIARFFQTCYEIQKPCGKVFQNAAMEFGVEEIFSVYCDNPPVLLKIVKYLPAYKPQKPHYDGSVFSLFLDSSDNQSLLFAPYRSSLTVDDFYAPIRKFSRWDQQHSMLLIPGVLLSDFFMDPTPHIVVKSNKNRYATIAFAMRPYHTHVPHELACLPTF